MAKLPQNHEQTMELFRLQAGLNGMEIDYEHLDYFSCYVLTMKSRVIASYSDADKMAGFLDALDFVRTGKGTED